MKTLETKRKAREVVYYKRKMELAVSVWCAKYNCDVMALLYIYRRLYICNIGREVERQKTLPI